MSVPITQESLAPLKVFVDLCTKNPNILQLPDLKFVKDFIENFGGKIPNIHEGENSSSAHAKDNETSGNDGDDFEDQCELDMTGVIGK